MLLIFESKFNPLSGKFIKWSKTLKQIVGNCLSVFDHFSGLALKRVKFHKKFVNPTSLIAYQG